MKPIWVIDDDQSIRFVLQRALEREQLPVRLFTDPREVIAALDAGDAPQVLVSDIRMPGGNGIELLAEVKQRQPALPVIIMTAYTDLDSAVGAYQSGAFEYLPKPFDLDELEARLRALVRRSAPEHGAAPAAGVQIGRIRFERDGGAIYRDGVPMELTPRELALMHALLAQPGHAVTKERLYELVFPGQLDVQYEAIEVVVYRLRKKLAGTGLTLMTLRGLGYLLRADT